MRKMTLLKVDELHKRYQHETIAVCIADGFVDSDGISPSSEHPMHITFDDKFAPELGQRLLVVVETLPSDLGPRTTFAKNEDSYAAYLNTRRDQLEGSKPVVEGGRKFR